MALGDIVRVDNEVLDHIEGNNGNLFKLGCLKPDKLKLTYPLLADKVPLYSFDEIRKKLDGRPYNARKIFDKSFIKNQKSHGSCNGFACATTLEKSRVLRGLKYVRLSGAGVYCLINDNRDDGSMLRDGMDALTNIGAIPESMGPWDKIYKRQYPSDIWDKIAYRFKAIECYHITNEQELGTALIDGFVCVVAVHVGNNFMRLDSNGSVGSDRGPGNHSVHVDDIRYSNGEFEFDLPNSWGPEGWGEDGRGWISWKRQLQYTVNNHEFFAVRSTINDPEDDEFPIITLSSGEKLEIPVEFPVAL